MPRKITRETDRPEHTVFAEGSGQFSGVILESYSVDVVLRFIALHPPFAADCRTNWPIISLNIKRIASYRAIAYGQRFPHALPYATDCPLWPNMPVDSTLQPDTECLHLA